MSKYVLQMLQFSNGVKQRLSEMCKIHKTFTSVWPLLPDTRILWHEFCIIYMQALINVNTTQAWFCSNGFFGGGNQDFNKHAAKTQTEYTGSQAASGMARRRGFQMSLKTALDEPFCHPAPPGTLAGHRECWSATIIRAPWDHSESWVFLQLV